VKYPNLYADKDNCPDADKRNKFNCVQRGHQNSLEIQPVFLALLILSGLGYPATAAALGASFLLGRVFYIKGYSTGDPARRINPGTMLYVVGLLGLQITCLKGAYDLITSQ
jgi:glutathione S-transferase